MKIKDKPAIQSRTYSFDFAKRLPAGDTFQSAAAPVVLGDVTVSQVTANGTKISLRIAGGTAGTDCKIMLSGTTAQAQTPAEPIVFSVI